MHAALFFKNWYIKCCRYLFKKRYLSIMAGPLKGYQWPTERSYEYITGTNEPPEVMSTFCSWFSPHSVFYDIGSNIGYYSFIANTFITNGRIYAFEPTSFNNELFKQLLHINKNKMPADNIELHEFAISDAEKEVLFSNNVNSAEGNTYIPGAPNFKGDTTKVPCYSIDTLCKMGYAPPDIIKIDVEGAEYDVLLGAAYTLATYKPNIFLATHNCIVPEIKEKCLTYLETLGYTITHTGYHNKTMEGLDDYLAIHKETFKAK
jgi:FkbM family methyltransferase